MGKHEEVSLLISPFRPGLRLLLIDFERKVRTLRVLHFNAIYP